MMTVSLLMNACSNCGLVALRDCGPHLQRHSLLSNGPGQPPFGSQHVMMALNAGLTRT